MPAYENPDFVLMEITLVYANDSSYVAALDLKNFLRDKHQYFRTLPQKF